MTSRQHTREDLYQERRKDEEYLVIISYIFVYLTKTTT